MHPWATGSAKLNSTFASLDTGPLVSLEGINLPSF